MIDREKIIVRIRALLSKTVENGCSEHEAMAAAEKAASLIREYDFTMSDIELHAARCVFDAETKNRKRIHESVNLMIQVSYFTNTRCLVERGRDNYNIIVFGLPMDVAFAKYIFAILENCMEAEWNKYKNSPSYPSHIHGNQVRKTFMNGMISRLAVRLNEMTIKNNNAISSSGATGNALVVVKNSILEEQFPKNINTKKASMSVAKSSGNAYEEGKKAGDRVNITTGIGNTNNASIKAA